MFVVDTNILVYAANHHSPNYAKASKVVDDWCRQNSTWYVTWGICYEFLRVSTHQRIYRSPLSAGEAWAFLEELFRAPGLGILLPGERHGTILAELLKEVSWLTGNRMYDAQIVALMREHGIRRIYTHDTDFHRFPFVEPLDPLRQSP